MNALTIFEFDKVVEAKATASGNTVPREVFSWLDSQCLRNDDDAPSWLKLTEHRGQRAVQFTSYVGVVRAPCGFQIEILPKIGKPTSKNVARGLLIKMLKCLFEFRHIKTADAVLDAVRMPLWEVFVQQFLGTVGSLVRRGLRSDYVAQQDNLFALRGKLLVAQQISQNLIRRDRFFTEYDEFSQNRAENRLIHSALRCVLATCRSQENQRMARELCFVFADIPLSPDVAQDAQRIRLDRGMGYYESALDWAKLILGGMNPTSSPGKQHAPSLLFPMETVFEAYVEKHLARQLQSEYVLKAQASSQYLVAHQVQHWFRLKPDLLVRDRHKTHVVLDTKWKLLDASKSNAREKYQLSQTDFYQLFAYGHHYLDGRGDLVLIYPKTDSFAEPLPIFTFPKAPEMRLWVLPFCLQTRRLLLPASLRLNELFSTGDGNVAEVVDAVAVAA